MDQNDNNNEKVEYDEITSGSYFKEGLDWYETRYISPISQMSFFCLCAAVAVITLFVNFGGIISLLPLSRNEVIYYTYTGDNSEVKVDKIRSIGEDANLATQRFYLKEYAKYRENYNSSRILANYIAVRSLSDGKTYMEFYNQVDYSNPNSPAVRYGNEVKRTIKVTNIEMPQLDKLEKQPDSFTAKANIQFTAQEIFEGKVIKTTEYVSEIRYNYQNMEVNQDTGAVSVLPNFKVIGYKVTKLP